MKIPGPFRPWHATLCLALFFCAGVHSQTAPVPVPEASKPDTMEQMHAAKVRSTALTITLAPLPPVKLEAAGGSYLAGDKSLTLTPAELAALPHETVTVVNGHTKASETYTGVPVAAILARLGMPFEKANEHKLLKTYIVAEGTDGYQVFLSVYETLAAIRQQSAIVADALNGQLLDKDGAFKLVVPGDTRPQRWVQNLKSLAFKTVE